MLWLFGTVGQIVSLGCIYTWAAAVAAQTMHLKEIGPGQRAPRSGAGRVAHAKLDHLLPIWNEVFVTYIETRKGREGEGGMEGEGEGERVSRG